MIMNQSQRISVIDFLKCVCIVLMVIFHLAYFSTKYPWAHQMVYVFHMPIFLILSGYLTHIGKPFKQTLKKIGWLFIPYAIMELAYVIMASILPINEHIDVLTFGVVLDKLFLHPIGPYWYLHTLILCYVVINILGYVKKYLSDMVFFILLGVVFYILYAVFHVMQFVNAMYFLVGFILAQKEWQIEKIFPASWWAMVPIMLLYVAPHLADPLNGLTCGTLRGVMIVYFMMCFLSAIYQTISDTKSVTICLFIGRNTLPILLFSPIFTFACKSLITLLAWDTTGLIFMIVSTIITVSGSLFIAWIMDKMHLSRWFSGKNLINR